MTLTDYKYQGRRGLAGIEDSINVSIQRLEDYIEKRGEGMVTCHQKQY